MLRGRRLTHAETARREDCYNFADVCCRPGKWKEGVMTASDHPDHVAELTAREFNRRIADPDVFCGGGSAAALACAGAAASALLVFRLSFRRKSNVARRDEIGIGIETIEQLIDDFYAAADADIAALQALLAAQRAARATGDNDQYIAALEHAAITPIRIAEQVGELLAVIVPHLPIASRFTISDLGAAATIAEGAARGALLTAEVNIGLLEENPASAEIAARLQHRWDAALEQSTSRTAEIERATRAAVRTTTRNEEAK